MTRIDDLKPSRTIYTGSLLHQQFKRSHLLLQDKMASYKHLSVFLQEVYDYADVNNINRVESFATLMKTKHYWPALQWKKFNDKSGLILLHNTYKRNDVDFFKELYDECRSVVLDLNAPIGENVVITLANSIPERLLNTQYKERMQDTDICYESYEGTVVSVYEHMGKWYFSTTSCPSIDSSRYFHPTKKHGEMLNEVLEDMFSSSLDELDTNYASVQDYEDSKKAYLRNMFTNKLDRSKAYFFILVHHDNQHVMDYTERWGKEYRKLIHIATRDRLTKTECVLPDPLVEEAFGYGKSIEVSKEVGNAVESLAWLDKNPDSYGIIVKKEDGTLYKVSNGAILAREEEDLGNPNPWINMLWVYMQNKPHYHVNDYISKFCPNLESPVDQYGRTLAPVYIIHTVICTVRDCLYQCYRYTTRYYPQHKRWKMNVVLDKQLPDIVRFHLAQLRNIQVTTHADEYITPHTIYHYLCHHQTMNNMRNLIGFFANPSENTFNMSSKTIECFSTLHRLLNARQVKKA